MPIYVEYQGTPITFNMEFVPKNYIFVATTYPDNTTRNAYVDLKSGKAKDVLSNQEITFSTEDGTSIAIGNVYNYIVGSSSIKLYQPNGLTKGWLIYA